GSSSAPARKVSTMAPAPARNLIQAWSAPRNAAPKAAPRTSCAAVPTRISESALATFNQMDSSAASSASPSQSAAKPQISVIDCSGGARLRRLPALRGLVVGGSRFDPARSLRSFFFLPERRAGLEVVHDEFAGREGLAAMGAGDHYEHDLIGGFQLADAVNHEHFHHVPAGFRFGDDLFERLLGHAGIVLQRHLHHHITVVDVTAQADKARHCTGLGVVEPERGDLCACVAVLGM